VQSVLDGSVPPYNYVGIVLLFSREQPVRGTDQLPQMEKHEKNPTAGVPESLSTLYECRLYSVKT
jgi:hypothetical protein